MGRAVLVGLLVLLMTSGEGLAQSRNAAPKKASPGYDACYQRLCTGDKPLCGPGEAMCCYHNDPGTTRRSWCMWQCITYCSSK
jgi:hypothetical protein